MSQRGHTYTNNSLGGNSRGHLGDNHADTQYNYYGSYFFRAVYETVTNVLKVPPLDYHRSFFPTSIGILPTFGGTQRLPRNVGRKAATELILTGRTFAAAEAARLGLINRVVAGTDLVDAALGLAAELATKPPLTIAAALGAIHRGMDAAIDDGLAIEEAAFTRIVPTHDAKEGIAAFLHRRPPCYRGN